ncbi:MAG: hypothetical protein H0V19_10410 [Euzebyales bacterium]|nr:hypothetical protein [Euzebyales bacterium]
MAALLDRHGRTFAAELGVDVAKGTPSPLFRMLCYALLSGARISADLAVRGAKALAEAGWTTARKMADSGWEQRARTLNEAGYARYDERTAGMLGDTSVLLLDRYGGDLRRLREQAQRDPDAERRLLKQCKGVGDVGVDIFFREVQAAWQELVPFADERALSAARRLGLGGDARTLARTTGRGGPQVARLVAALVRCDLAGDYDAVRAAAG